MSNNFLRQFEVVIEIANRGSISKAADETHPE